LPEERKERVESIDFEFSYTLKCDLGPAERKVERERDRIVRLADLPLGGPRGMWRDAPEKVSARTPTGRVSKWVRQGWNITAQALERGEETAAAREFEAWLRDEAHRLRKKRRPHRIRGLWPPQDELSLDLDSVRTRARLIRERRKRTPKWESPEPTAAALGAQHTALLGRAIARAQADYRGVESLMLSNRGLGPRRTEGQEREGPEPSRLPQSWVDALWAAAERPQTRRAA
jgi:hypothetical protein